MPISSVVTLLLYSDLITVDLLQKLTKSKPKSIVESNRRSMTTINCYRVSQKSALSRNQALLLYYFNHERGLIDFGTMPASLYNRY